MANNSTSSSGAANGFSDEWNDVAKAAGTSGADAKALYVVGLMRNLTEAAGKCLDGQHAFTLPAFVLIADTAELMGRYLLGSTEEQGVSRKLATAGFGHLLGGNSWTSASGTGFVYTPSNLYQLRCFTMHGATTPGSGGEPLELELIHHLRKAIVDEIDRFWSAYKAGDTELRTKLDLAAIAPLWTGGVPIFIADVQTLVAQGSASANLLYY